MHDVSLSVSQILIYVKAVTFNSQVFRKHDTPQPKTNAYCLLTFIHKANQLNSLFKSSNGILKVKQYQNPQGINSLTLALTDASFKKNSDQLQLQILEK